MAISVSQAFKRTSANPIDETLTLTKAQMLTVNDNLMPNKYLTVCQDDGAIYLYDKSTTPSAETGKFTKFEGGGGQGGSGITIDATLLASGWDSNTKQQTVTFTGYESAMGGVIGVPASATTAQKGEYATAKINVISVSGTSFTFECDEIPSIDLPVTLYAGGSGGGGADLPSGGTTGQVLAKHSNADGDVEWKDDGGGQTIQYDTMPQADVTNLGQIVQFIGTTDANYTNGLFYECVSDGQSTPTYSWEIKDVQTYPEVDLTNVFASGFPVASVSGGSNPVGTIISFFGLNAPDGYLVCDGNTYNRADYPTLAQHLTSQFSSLVGDGSTTFTVPDLRGEFLRGAGTNSHTDQGSGGAVGTHQDGTIHTELNTDTSSAYITKSWIDHKADSRVGTTLSYGRTDLVSDSSTSKNFTSRPTNTSVLYCIKY